MTLVKVLEQRLTWYTHAHDMLMTAPALAQMLSITLYSRRFFPYYVWNTLGGLDREGRGCVFSYDPVGNFEKRLWNCAGSAGHLIQPFLDNQVCVCARVRSTGFPDRSSSHSPTHSSSRSPTHSRPHSTPHTSQIGHKHQPEATCTPLSQEQVVRIVKDAFTSATERDIYTGDFLEIFIITKDGVTKELVPLKKD